MKKALSHRDYQKYSRILEGKGKMDSDLAETIAQELKKWAQAKGATHYTHWFQPLTGYGAEKHDSFFAWSKEGEGIEKFRGKDLMQAEPDASSFPSGGLRSTHEARGYTTWDPASFPFLWNAADGCTLCIPSLFFSWKGDALDHKIPLLRSEEKIEEAVLRLLKLCRRRRKQVLATLGPEQEYFAIDAALFALRPDLVLAGRTLFGAKPAKGQQLEDHYFGVVKDRVLAYMRDFEESALCIGIPVKTRHNEVAPSQFEMAPLFEPSSAAVDHNILLMELMRQKALEHDLVCLLHEKPFAGLNGSGKHNNWSLATDSGVNLLDPNGNPWVFLTLLTATLRAVHEHAGLLRASIGSAGNDRRLGGSEAPPNILSVYLGASLNESVHRFLQGKEKSPSSKKAIDLKIHRISSFEADSSDRNRTSFFAFTGNKFEFRAVGSSAHCALPISVINAIVADSLHLILDEIEDAMKDSKKFSRAETVLRKHLSSAMPVVFEGDGYSSEWEKEAAKRGLLNIRKSPSAFGQFLDKKSIRVFEGILSEAELHARYDIFMEQYAKAMQIETSLMIELFRTQILPAVLEDQKGRAESIKAVEGKKKSQSDSVENLSQAINRAIELIDALEAAEKKTAGLGWDAQAKVYSEIISSKMDETREAVDFLETIVDDRLWPLPKYRELLFSL